MFLESALKAHPGGGALSCANKALKNRDVKNPAGEDVLWLRDALATSDLGAALDSGRVVRESSRAFCSGGGKEEDARATLCGFPFSPLALETVRGRAVFPRAGAQREWPHTRRTRVNSWSSLGAANSLSLSRRSVRAVRAS